MPSKVRARTKVSFTPVSGKRPAGVPEDLDEIVQEIIGRVADKWTMLVLEVLDQHGTLRFTQIAAEVGEISQKMLTKTLRQMEADGFVTRRVYPVVPPKVEYTLTKLGESLGAAFCGVWTWAEKHHAELSPRFRKKRLAGEASA